MRCSCVQCDTYMIQSESGQTGCVCPECGYRCHACMGTNTVISREDLFRRGEELLHTLGLEEPAEAFTESPDAPREF